MKMKKTFNVQPWPPPCPTFQMLLLQPNPLPPPSHPMVLPSSPSASLFYFTYDGKEIDDALLNRCTRLFGKNYGIWGTNPTSMKAPKAGSSPPFLHLLNKPNQNSGSQVKMFGAKLRKQCMAVPNSTVLAVCYQPTQGHWSLLAICLRRYGIMIRVSVCHLWWTPSANVEGREFLIILPAQKPVALPMYFSSSTWCIFM